MDVEETIEPKAKEFALSCKHKLTDSLMLDIEDFDKGLYRCILCGAIVTSDQVKKIAPSCNHKFNGSFMINLEGFYKGIYVYRCRLCNAIVTSDQLRKIAQ